MCVMRCVSSGVCHAVCHLLQGISCNYVRKIKPGRIASTKIVILDSTDIQEAAPSQNYLFAAYAIALEIPAATIASTSQTKVP